MENMYFLIVLSLFFNALAQQNIPGITSENNFGKSVKVLLIHNVIGTILLIVSIFRLARKLGFLFVHFPDLSVLVDIGYF